MLNRLPWWLPALAGVVFFVAHNVNFQPWTLDDAFITFRYSENLAQGLGPVYNAGDRVEGYTNFLWMFILAGANRVGADTVMAAKLLGFLCASTTFFLLAAAHRIVPGIPQRVACIAALLAGTSPIISRWGMSSMGVPLLELLLVSAGLLHLRERAGASRNALASAVSIGVLCAMAMMTRPNGALLFGVLALDRLWMLLRDPGGPRRSRMQGLLVFAGTFVLLYGSYYGWRFSYYGWPLPNTFYVKVGASGAQLLRGVFYLAQFIFICWYLLLALFVALAPRMRPAGGHLSLIHISEPTRPY